MLTTITVSAGPARAASGPIGMETLKRLDRLPLLRAGTRCLQYSSHDRSGGNNDGFEGTYSHLYKEGSRYVIFDHIGPGCVYQIWFTSLFIAFTDALLFTGDLEIYLDGEAEPTVRLPIRDFFGGLEHPFLVPLAGKQTLSSGGVYSYVPIPFRERCKIATTRMPFFFHIVYHALDGDLGVETFTLDVDPTEVIDMWTHPGEDPKGEPSGPVIFGTVAVEPGETAVLVDHAGAGSVAAIHIDPEPATRDVLDEAWLRIYWDGESEASVDAPVGTFFGSGLGEATVLGLPVGMSRCGPYYCYFPMPFWSSARIEVANAGCERIESLSYEILLDETPYPAGRTGYFHARWNEERPTTPGRDYTILAESGWGHFVGEVLTMENLETSGNPYARNYLEGDIRVHTDGSPSPSLYDTGTEDYFNGGWYFMWGRFNLPCHGNPVHLVYGADRTGCYRFHLSDAIPFYSGIRFGIEHGPGNDVPADYSSVAYYYLSHEAGPALELSDSLDVGDPADEEIHGYTADGVTWSGSLTSFYEGDDDDVPVTDHGVSLTGASRFTLSIAPDNTGVRLRRRMDHNDGRQRALVFVDGAEAGTWHTPDGNCYKRWLDAEFDLAPELTSGKSEIALRIENVNPAVPWSEHYYWAYSYHTFIPDSLSVEEDDVGEAWDDPAKGGTEDGHCGSCAAVPGGSARSGSGQGTIMFVVGIYLLGMKRRARRGGPMCPPRHLHGRHHQNGRTHRCALPMSIKGAASSAPTSYRTFKTGGENEVFHLRRDVLPEPPVHRQTVPSR